MNPEEAKLCVNGNNYYLNLNNNQQLDKDLICIACGNIVEIPLECNKYIFL